MSQMRCILSSDPDIPFKWLAKLCNRKIIYVKHILKCQCKHLECKVQQLDFQFKMTDEAHKYTFPDSKQTHIYMGIHFIVNVALQINGKI